MSEASEFGAGIAVCLAKFSEHLENRWAEKIICALTWEQMPAVRRQQYAAEAERFPHGDSAQIVGAALTAERLGGIEHMWLNGASDHFYDLDESAGPKLKELAALTLAIGHGFDGSRVQVSDFRRVHELWREAVLELDRRLGVAPDWGQW